MNYTSRAPIGQPVPKLPEHDIPRAARTAANAGTRRRINCLSHISHYTILLDSSSRNPAAVVEFRWAPGRERSQVKRRMQSFIILRNSDRHRQRLR
jgi:hypothetical protein